MLATIMSCSSTSAVRVHLHIYAHGTVVHIRVHVYVYNVHAFNMRLQTCTRKSRNSSCVIRVVSQGSLRREGESTSGAYQFIGSTG